MRQDCSVFAEQNLDYANATQPAAEMSPAHRRADRVWSARYHLHFSVDDGRTGTPISQYAVSCRPCRSSTRGGQRSLRHSREWTAPGLRLHARNASVVLLEPVERGTRTGDLHAAPQCAIASSRRPALCG